tara:strand:- start:1978 stop:3114 length:1137 start_codon:yes stop_codon:yes gene_type:complete
MDYELVIIGAGVVGLAVAARAARSCRSVLVLERHQDICRETSSRHSEVVHAGLYYPQSSLKAKTCVAGRELLYARCKRLNIEAPRIGKYIVALNLAQERQLHDLAERGANNGVDDLSMLSSSELRINLPGVAATAALWSPSTGVVDSHQYAASFQSEAEANGATFAFRTELIGAEPIEGGYQLLTRNSGAGDNPTPFPLRCHQVVNSGGLGQDRISQLIGINIDAAGYRNHPCKGDYFRIAPRHQHRSGPLIYPVGKAAGAGLGVHICYDTAGGMRLGPDASYISGPPFDYRVDASKRRAFFAAASPLLPWLKEEDLSPDQSGIRPKLSAPGGGFCDFVIKDEAERGLSGWITLAGIESPGLTSAAAIAEEVAALLEV